MTFAPVNGFRVYSIIIIRSQFSIIFAMYIVWMSSSQSGRSTQARHTFRLLSPPPTHTHTHTQKIKILHINFFYELPEPDFLPKNRPSEVKISISSSVGQELHCRCPVPKCRPNDMTCVSECGWLDPRCGTSLRLGHKQIGVWVVCQSREAGLMFDAVRT